MWFIRQYLEKIKFVLNEIAYYRLAYLFVLPAVILILVVRLYPILYAIRLSLYHVYIGRKGTFIGLDNYRRLAHEVRFADNLMITLFYVAAVVVASFLLGFILALILNRIRGRVVFRAIILIPWVISLIVAALMWRWLVDPMYGLVNAVLKLMGFPPTSFFIHARLAMGILIFATIWRSTPFPMILLLAGLQSIPQELYEAARVDGISARTQLTDITVPLLKPTMLVTLIMTTVFTLFSAELPLALTGGGPVYKTEVLGLRLYREAFEYFNLGYASAMGVIILVINIMAIAAYTKMLRTEVHY